MAFMKPHHRRRRRHQVHLLEESKIPLLLSFVFFFSAVSVLSDFNPATNTLLNCGGSAAVTLTQDGRNFVPDANSKLLTSSGSSVSVNNQINAANSTVYETARVFTEVFSYEFIVGSTGTHFLRLHFFPFSATVDGVQRNLSDSNFSVSAPDNFSILSGLSDAESSLPIIKEYLIGLSQGKKLKLTFTPAVNSFAFVNAIELFSAPDNLFPDNATYITNSENQTKISGITTSMVMETVYRINVGGDLVTPVNDTVSRTWVNDKIFLLSSNLTEQKVTSDIKYPSGRLPTKEFAPLFVYSSLQQMNLVPSGGSQTNTFNLTWIFNVSLHYRYFVRMHFCDFVSTGDELTFNAYLNNLLANQIRPSTETEFTQSQPFYFDFVVDAEKAESAERVRVSVGPSTASSSAKVNAFLNGLEIMKIMDLNSSDSGGGNTGVITIAASVAGSIVVVVLIGVSLFCYCKRRKPEKLEKNKSESGGGDGTVWTSVVGTSVTTANGGGSGNMVPMTPMVHFCLQISLEELKFATDGFNESRVVGSGGFGKVYKGQLRDGTAVAVKRATPTASQGHLEFRNEIMVLSQVRHRHLVSLIGYCNESGQMILVYEYMNLGTLKSHLYRNPINAGKNNDNSENDTGCGCRKFLSWEQRLRICIGAAKGLHYLHTGYSPGIIHRDVKASNILLTAVEGDEDYLAKVSDFGLSKVGPDVGETHVSTAVKGSFGYLDPEYFKTQKLTEKSDVYSFGVVMFEILCARPAIDQMVSREEMNLAEYAVAMQKRGRLEEIVDAKLAGKINGNSLRKFGETAERCLAEASTDRPNMGDVLWNLDYALQLQLGSGRERTEDSVVSHVSIPTGPDVERVTFPAPRRTKSATETKSNALTASSVFSQLMTGDGR